MGAKPVIKPSTDAGVAGGAKRVKRKSPLPVRGKTISRSPLRAGVREKLTTGEADNSEREPQSVERAAVEASKEESERK